MSPAHAKVWLSWDLERVTEQQRRLREAHRLAAVAIQSNWLERARAFVVANPALLASRSTGNLTLLQVAANFRRHDFAAELVAMGAKLDFTSAVALGWVEEAGSMVSKAPRLAKSHSPDRWGAIHLAVQSGSPEMVELLLSAGADVNDQRNPHALTPLFFAVDDIVAELLLTRGAEINIRSKNGFTALHCAAEKGNLNRVHFLLAHGAQPDLQTDGRQTAWALAVRRGHRAVADRLSCSATSREDHTIDHRPQAMPIPARSRER
ncbi:MAG: ankyrin repeat domain-containing protein [Bryobacteraceae bacterium]|nr:ankyrin repeat domain-containing protein [Bryobacteraceae bacterium]